MVCNFILHAYLGRSLGPELYGVFGVISAFIFVNEYMLLKGVYETISKFIAEQDESAKTIIRMTLKMLGTVCLLVGAVYFLFAQQIALLMNDPELSVYIKLFSFIIPIVGISTVYLGALNGLRQFGRQALISIVFSTVRLVSVILLVFLGFSVKGAVLGLILAELFRLGISKRLCRPANVNIKVDGRKIFRFGLQLMGIALVSSLIMNLDLFAVKIILKDNLQTGFYTAATTIAKAGLFLMFPVALTVIPTISKSISDGNRVLTEQYIEKALRLLLMFVLPLSLIIMATSRNCISIIYGDSYLAASGALNMLILATVLLSLKVVMYNVMVASGRPRYIILIGMFSLFIDVLLMMALVPRMGLMGAAMATAITHAFGFLLSYWYVARKYMTRALSPSLIRIVLASLAVYFIARLYAPAGMMLFLYYVLLLCVFFVILVMMKEINITVLKLRLIEAWGLFRLRGLPQDN